MTTFVQCLIAVIFVMCAFFMDYGTDKLPRECVLASNAKEVPGCDYDPEGHGED